MSKVSRAALTTIMGSVNSHNRAVEERECWRRRRDELDRTRRRSRQTRKTRPDHRDESNGPYQRRDSTFRGRAYADNGNNYRFRDRRSPVPSRVSFDRAGHLPIPSGKWGHEGFWELYPEERENKPRRPLREVEHQSKSTKQTDFGGCYMDHEGIKNVKSINRRVKSPSSSSTSSSSSSSSD